jgi:tetratricopeptide (TPR) repeat protein
VGLSASRRELPIRRLAIVGFLVTLPVWASPFAAAFARDIAYLHLTRSATGADSHTSRSWFGTALSFEPTDERSRVGLATIFQRNGAPGEALNVLESLGSEGVGYQVWLLRGDAEELNGDHLAALAAWRHVADLAEHHRRLAEQHAAAGLWATARREATLALEIDPAFGPGYRTLGKIQLSGSGDAAAAVGSYESAIELGAAQQDAYLYVELAHALDMDGRLDDAVSVLDEHGINGPLADTMRGTWYLVHGDAVKAQRYLERAHLAAPDDPWTLLQLGFAYRARGDLNEARQSWLAALRIDPNFAEARRALDAQS